VTEPLMSFKSHIRGKNADVAIFQDRVEWNRGGVSAAKLTAGFITAGMSLVATGVRPSGSGSEMIPIRAITSVATKRDGVLNTIVSVASSSGEIPFRVGHREAAEIKRVLDGLILNAHNTVVNIPDPGTASAPVSPTPTPDYGQQLVQLGQLRDAGVITEEEFQAKKTELLNRM